MQKVFRLCVATKGPKLMNREVFKKELWNIAKKRLLEDRGALFREDGDLLREYQAMQKENFFSSWLREDVDGRKQRKKKEVVGKEGWGGERERVETCETKKSCMNRVDSTVPVL